MGDFTQTRIVRFEVLLPMQFPRDQDDWEINFRLNESSWCMSNLIELLEEYDREHGCLCHICTARVVPNDPVPGCRTHHGSTEVESK